MSCLVFIRHYEKDGGMSIGKMFFLKFKSAAKTLKKYLTNHINLTKFAFFPMKIFVSLATSSVKIMNFSFGNTTCRCLSNTVVFVFVYDNKAVNEHEKTANL